ncbi:hypothetical protein Rsub_09064 [Raphidocelis subcapitata]|uniref:Uncharacterized protein n=1 Tax=Raphidocelis subcapitata TaxID=307507 RepID=A0A2V0P9M1_9CHLO|nr:hypothetical protein Rsub_09064 [Raphidocelis subcapitata]|eukprot:GBF96269.1 hypothetical protein Rsub_09064 [Raphidocelis subcapitata]
MGCGALAAILLLMAAAPRAAAGHGRELLTNPLRRCKHYTNCEGRTISSIRYCLDGATGCITSLEFGFAPSAQPAKAASCSATCTGGFKTLTLSAGEVITSYTYTRSGGGSNNCMTGVSFATSRGNTLTAGAAGTAAAAGNDTSALSASGARTRSRTKTPRRVPHCLKKRTAPMAPFGELCSLKSHTCGGPGGAASALERIKPEWGYHSQCGLTKEQAAWSCAAPTCTPGTTVQLAGKCSTAVPGGVVSYSDPSGAPITDVPCPPPGSKVPVVPVLDDQGCKYPGDGFAVEGVCPPPPTFSCGPPPACAYAGVSVPLAGTCNCSDPSASVTYVVDGRAVTSVNCPNKGTDLKITASASISTLPQCPYDPDDVGLSLSSVCASEAAAAVTCSPPPPCSYAGEVIKLTGLCTTPLAGATVIYELGGKAVTSVTCPAPTRPASVVQPKVTAPDGSGGICSYPKQPQVIISPSRCAAASQVPITCGAPPDCAYAGDTKSLSGLCSVQSGPLAGAAVAYYVDGAPVTSITCPAPGKPLSIQPRVVTSDQCIYNGPVVNVDSDCPDDSTISVPCKSMVCPNAGASVSLAASCTTTAPGAVVGYTVNGAAAVKATCPAPGDSVTVQSFVTGYGGPGCQYPGGSFTITSTCPPSPQGTVTCKAIKCRFAGDKRDLVDTCTSSTGSTVDYYTPTGTKVTTINCVAPNADPLVLIPRVTIAGCVSNYDPITVPPSECPATSQAQINCSPVTCSSSGVTVPLNNTCTTALSGGVVSFLVNGEKATKLTCPEPGVEAKIEPVVENYGGNAACAYVGPSYTVTSSCPSALAARVKCNAPTCDQPGTVVPLAGLCSTALAGAVIETTVNGTKATSLTCPDAGETLMFQGWIKGYLGSCNYASNRVPVTSTCGATPPSLTCPNFECREAGATFDLAAHCSVGESVKFYVSGNQVTSVACPKPGSPLTVSVAVTDSGCEYTSTLTGTSACWSDAQASPTCNDITCSAGDSIDLAAASCSSPLAGKPGAAWSYDPSSPATCPATVKATLTVGNCTYDTTFKLESAACEPGSYPLNGTCVDCGYGAYCPDGVARMDCPDFETTRFTNSTAASDCLVTECSPCSGATPQVYFTTGKDMSIWRTDAFIVGGTLDKMCYFNSPDFDTINDIAIDANGDAIVIVRKGSSDSSARMIKVRTSTLPSPDPNRVCEFEDLLVGGFPDPLNPNKTGDAWAGLGAGRKSNIMYGSNGNTIFTVDVSTSPPKFLANLATNLGGGSADITLGPDNNLYLAQNNLMYRITLAADGITPTGIEQIHENGSNMAGAFCTSEQPYATENSQFHKLVEMYPTYERGGPMLFNPDTNVGGFSGAATVPSCH